jgi:hypothetical protein
MGMTRLPHMWRNLSRTTSSMWGISANATRESRRGSTTRRSEPEKIVPSVSHRHRQASASGTATIAIVLSPHYAQSCRLVNEKRRDSSRINAVVNGLAGACIPTRVANELLSELLRSTATGIDPVEAAPRDIPQFCYCPCESIA